MYLVLVCNNFSGCYIPQKIGDQFLSSLTTTSIDLSSSSSSILVKIVLRSREFILSWCSVKARKNHTNWLRCWWLSYIIYVACSERSPQTCCHNQIPDFLIPFGNRYYIVRFVCISMKIVVQLVLKVC